MNAIFQMPSKGKKRREVHLPAVPGLQGPVKGPRAR